MGLMPGDVDRPRLEEYAEKYSHILALQRTDGILEARLHSNGGVFGSTGWFNVWHQAWAEIGNDPANDVVIITGTGDRWIDYLYPADEEITEATRQVFDALKSALGSEDLIADIYSAALKNTHNVVFGLDVPTIGVIQGPAFVHYEMALFCDVTLCAENAVFRDPHAELGVAPGDGLGLAFQHLMNPKQQAYYLYTSDTIDAPTALRLGMVNEVLPSADLMPRAREIARQVLRMPRLSRLMAKQIVRRSATRRHTDDAAFHLAHELLGFVRNVQDGDAHSPERVRDSVLDFAARIQRKHDA